MLLRSPVFWRPWSRLSPPPFSRACADGPAMLGFAAALVAVWLLSSEKGAVKISLETLRLPVMAGLGFGLYLVLIGLGENTQIFWSLVAARISALALLLIVFLCNRSGQSISAGGLWPFVLMAGLFDAGGNAFFGLGVQLGRLDVAGVLAALYPGGTVLLAVVFLKESLMKRHWFGLAAAILALGLISH